MADLYLRINDRNYRPNRLNFEILYDVYVYQYNNRCLRIRLARQIKILLDAAPVGNALFFRVFSYYLATNFNPSIYILKGYGRRFGTFDHHLLGCSALHIFYQHIIVIKP